jgi:diguanylate cyclase (GGDEF)-like protein
MPLVLDAMFYIVLRERFVLLHAGMTMAMLAYVLFTGGIINAFADVPVSLQAVLGPLVWAIGVGLGGLFTVSFLERGTLPDWLRNVVIGIGWWTMLVPGFFALQLDATQPFDNQLYFATIAFSIPVYLIAIVVALFAGSRAARYLVVAWLPLILAAGDRLLRGTGTYSGPATADQALFMALALEVTIISLGVAERFLIVRRERDLALNQARSLGELSERDPMTGLLNRRAVVERFDTLRKAGFTTLALLDIDHFKSVNDSFGHNAGDNTLRAVARALQPDEDCIAVRMGGEEFLLLLRGPNGLQRAEQRRQAIVMHVANAAQLDRPVTASMGLVDAPLGALADAGFEAIYARADKLLYEAKSSGRNRTISERLKVFRKRQEQRRTAAAA